MLLPPANRTGLSKHGGSQGRSKINGKGKIEALASYSVRAADPDREAAAGVTVFGGTPYSKPFARVEINLSPKAGS